jgi:hypothetical protein
MPTVSVPVIVRATVVRTVAVIIRAVIGRRRTIDRAVIARRRIARRGATCNGAGRGCSSALAKARCDDVAILALPAHLAPLTAAIADLDRTAGGDLADNGIGRSGTLPQVDGRVDERRRCLAWSAGRRWSRLLRARWRRAGLLRAGLPHGGAPHESDKCRGNCQSLILQDEPPTDFPADNISHFQPHSRQDHGGSFCSSGNGA